MAGNPLYGLKTGGSGQKTWTRDPGSGERTQPEAMLSPPLLREPNWCNFLESPHRTFFSLAHCFTALSSPESGPEAGLTYSSAVALLSNVLSPRWIPTEGKERLKKKKSSPASSLTKVFPWIMARTQTVRSILEYRSKEYKGSKEQSGQDH